MRAKYFLFFLTKRLPIIKKVKISGRSRSGQIICYNRGGGLKKLYRKIDIHKFIWNVRGLILAKCYNSGYTSSLFLVLYANGILTYMLSSLNKSIGTFIFNTNIIRQTHIGDSKPLQYFLSGSIISNLEHNRWRGAQFIRAAFCFGKIVTAFNNYVLVKIKAKKIFKIIFDCVGVFGQLDCWRILMHKKVNRAKYNIYQGKKPCVRGVAKNPIDHPHGGGHGKTSGGRPSVSRWARITKGPKTKSWNYGTFHMERQISS